MKLYFSPMACSMSARIALYEAEAQVEFILTDTKTKKLLDGGDFYQINPLGQVPVLEIEGGKRITENTAVLQYIARQYPKAALMPTADPELAQFQQWLGFITSEIHKGIFINLFDQAIPDAVKQHLRDKGRSRFDLLERHLAQGRPFLIETFTLADAYLWVVLNWCPYTGVDLTQWPRLYAYHEALKQRPSIARAFAEEWDLYQQEQKKKTA